MERKGQVVKSVVASFRGLESVAKSKMAKGCFFERGRSCKEGKIEEWLRGYEESDFSFGEIATTQAQIATSKNQCDADCEDKLCKDIASGVDNIPDACEKLVACLPESFRENVRSDAESIANMCVRLCPDIPWLTFRLEIVQYDACWRWHQDAYVGRAIITYVGPGTYCCNDQDVHWDQLDSIQDDRNNSSVSASSVKQMKTNSVLLMKGDTWPNICGKGLVHKSPEVKGNPPKRFILKVDLNKFRPPLDFDEESSDDEENESGNEDRQPNRGLLKRLETSGGFKSARAWKVPRRA